MEIERYLEQIIIAYRGMNSMDTLTNLTFSMLKEKKGMAI